MRVTSGMPKLLVLFLSLVATLLACLPEPASPAPSAASTRPPTKWTPADLIPDTKLTPDTNFIHTEARYAGPDGQTVLLQNSLPKGGSSIEPGGEVGYTAPDGTHYRIGVFWTRAVNEGDTPLELSLDLPPQAYPVADSTANFYRLFLPTDSMTLAKRAAFNYGIEGLRGFLDRHYDTGSRLHRTIPPGGETLFYVVLLLRVPSIGPIRAGVVAGGRKLAYRVRITPFAAREVPLGTWSVGR